MSFYHTDLIFTLRQKKGDKEQFKEFYLVKRKTKNINSLMRVLLYKCVVSLIRIPSQQNDDSKTIWKNKFQSELRICTNNFKTSNREQDSIRDGVPK